MALNIIKGSIIAAKETYIAHQCNCATFKSAGLAKLIFEHFPEADYANVSMSDRLPGRITIHGRIINMYAQIRPGRPTTNETRAMRLQWLRRCLFEVSESLTHDVSLALPYGIGCGLAGGDWDDTYALIKRFADYVDFDITLYRLK